MREPLLVNPITKQPYPISQAKLKHLVKAAAGGLRGSTPIRQAIAQALLKERTQS